MWQLLNEFLKAGWELDLDLEIWVVLELCRRAGSVGGAQVYPIRLRGGYLLAVDT